MKRTCLLSLTIILFSGLFVVTGAASGPGMINYQGLLKDSSGDPLTGTVTVTFRIYDAATGDNILWQEIHPSVSVSDGQLSVILGQGTPPVAIGDEVFESAERWLGITIESDPELSPRTRLVSVPYSHRVNTVAGAEAGVINGVLEIGNSSKDGSRYESGIIVTGTGADSVIISPADDIIIRGTTDDGDAAVFMGTVTNGDVSSGVVEVSSTDAAKAGNRKVLINPGDSIVLQGTDGDGDVAISMGMNEYGGSLHVSSTDAAKFDPDAITSSVVIAPANNVALQAEDVSGDTLINLTTSGSEGRITLKSSAGDGLSRVQIGDDGIYFFDDTRGDTTMILHANGSVTGKGQIAMGLQHADLADWSNVIGYDNEASGDSAVVSGGYGNVASGYVSTVSGGRENTAGGSYSTVSGGSGNDASGSHNSIGGGYGNTTANQHSRVGGGASNIAGSDGALVAGGRNNRARAVYACVVGGGGSTPIDSNSAQGAFSFVGGGQKNTSAGHYGIVIGGLLNIAGYYSVVLGGYDNHATGDFSVAVGSCAKANHSGSIIISTSDSGHPADSTSSGGDEQMILRADGGIYLTNTAEVAPYNSSRLITTRGGAYLSGNGTSWTDASDRNLKENFVDLNYADILAKLRQLPMSEWNYIAEDDGVRHVGPMGQDFYGIFGIGQDEKSISARDLASIALIAAQELDRKTEQLESSLKEIDDLRRELDELKNLVKSISISEDM